jgi:1-acyl-sn-glycerol-3-phosphate acyltransferase
VQQFPDNSILNRRPLLRSLLSRKYDINSIDNRDPAAIERVLPLVENVLAPYFRSEVRGLHHVPSGAALYVGNHSAGIMTPDSFLFAAAVYRAHGLDGLPYGLANEIGVSLPLIHQLIVPLGAVRASHANAHGLFARGRKALVYPGGEFDAMRPSRHRHRIVFEGRLGYVRLAVRAGVPIVPVVTAGGHDTFYVLDDGRWLAKLLQMDRLLRIKVWPITLCLPWGLMIGAGFPYVPMRTRILTETLAPIHFDRTGEAAAADEAYLRTCAQRVESVMQAALDRLALERDAAESPRQEVRP